MLPLVYELRLYVTVSDLKTALELVVHAQLQAIIIIFL